MAKTSSGGKSSSGSSSSGTKAAGSGKPTSGTKATANTAKSGGGGLLSGVKNVVSNISNALTGGASKGGDVGRNLPGSDGARRRGESQATYEQRVADREGGGGTLVWGKDLAFATDNPATTITEDQYRQGKAAAKVTGLVAGPIGLAMNTVVELQRRGILPPNQSGQPEGAPDGRGSVTDRAVQAVLANPTTTDAQKNAEIKDILQTAVTTEVGQQRAVVGLNMTKPLYSSVYGQEGATKPENVFDRPQGILSDMSSRLPTLDANTPGTILNPNDPRYALTPNALGVAGNTVGSIATATTTGPTRVSTYAPTMANLTLAQGADPITAAVYTPAFGNATTIDEVAPKSAATYTAATTIGDIMSRGQAVAQQGTVSDKAIIRAEQLDLQGAATGVNADGSVNATGVALNSPALQGLRVIDTSTVAGRLLAEELGEGNYTDAKATMQGQLEILTKQFVDPTTGEPTIPSWAAGVARNVSRIAAFKGMTGTAATAAMSQALIEASLPIAQQDASFFQTLTVTNLNNRQQMAVQKAQVLANMDLANLDARMTAAVENAKSFLQMDLANLNNRQQTEIINTQARVQSILEDAKATNAARMFAAESQNDFTKFYDQLNGQIRQFNAAQVNEMSRLNVAAANQASQFNAAQQNQTAQFNVSEFNRTQQFNANAANNNQQFNAASANTAAQFSASERNAMRRFDADAQNRTSQFNAAQFNDVARFNVSEQNATARFNAELENQRELFYREMQYNVDLANARWRQTVATTDTQMKFEAARIDVQNLVNLSTEAMNRMWDREDSLFDYAWKSTESELERQVRIYAADKGYAIDNRRLENEEDAALGGAIFGAIDMAGKFFDWW